MDYRTLDLTIISAKGLKNGATLFGKSDVYAVVSTYGTDSNQKFITPVCKKGGSNPTWNFPMKFTVDYAAILQKRAGIVVEIKAVGMFRDRKFGEVWGKFIPKDVSTEGKGQKVVNFTVRTPSGKVNGSLTFSYRFGEEYSGNADEPVTAVGSTYAAKGQHKHQPSAQKRPKKSKSGKGLGGCLLGGALHAAFLHGGGCGCRCRCRCGSGGGDVYGIS